MWGSEEKQREALSLQSQARHKLSQAHWMTPQPSSSVPSQVWAQTPASFGWYRPQQGAVEQHQAPQLEHVMRQMQLLREPRSKKNE